MPSRKLVTLHPPMAAHTAMTLLKSTQEAMDMFGFRTWVTIEDPSGQVTLMVDAPLVWHERGPTQNELDHFFRLYESGRIAEAQEFAKIGFPAALR